MAGTQRDRSGEEHLTNQLARQFGRADRAIRAIETGQRGDDMYWPEQARAMGRDAIAEMHKVLEEFGYMAARYERALDDALSHAATAEDEAD